MIQSTAFEDYNEWCHQSGRDSNRINSYKDWIKERFSVDVRDSKMNSDALVISNIHSSRIEINNINQLTDGEKFTVSALFKERENGMALIEAK